MIEEKQLGREQLDPPRRAVGALHAALGEHLIAVVLFGSRARGEATEESDWDLLVIAEGLPENVFDRHIFLGRLLTAGPPAAVSFLAKTPGEFEAHIPSLYLDIALDGQILYDPCGYAAEKLAVLQRLVGRLGLYRERTEAGDMWRWKKEPTSPWALEWGE